MEIETKVCEKTIFYIGKHAHLSLFSHYYYFSQFCHLTIDFYPSLACLLKTSNASFFFFPQLTISITYLFFIHSFFPKVVIYVNSSLYFCSSHSDIFMSLHYFFLQSFFNYLSPIIPYNYFGTIVPSIFFKYRS